MLVLESEIEDGVIECKNGDSEMTIQYCVAGICTDKYRRDYP